MAITATWSDLEPGTVVDRETHERTLATPDDVWELVRTLAEPNTSEAYLVHTARPKRYNELFDENQADHEVVVGIRHGFGYLQYADPNEYAQFAGDPSSPDWHTTEQGYFYPGTGVALDVLVAALTEFLITGERPTGVRWRELDQG